MGKDILTFGDIEIEKNIFYSSKSPVHLRDIGTEKILVSKKISSSEKKIVNTSLVTFVMMTKLSHYI